MMGKFGKWPVKVRLIDRHILDGNNARLALHLDHAIDQQKRIAVGKNLHDLDNVERSLQPWFFGNCVLSVFQWAKADLQLSPTTDCIDERLLRARAASPHRFDRTWKEIRSSRL